MIASLRRAQGLFNSRPLYSGPFIIPKHPSSATIVFRQHAMSTSASSTNAGASAATPRPPPPVPRPSASLVIVNHRNEILLVQRNPKASAFGGMHVFPGGNFDKKQDASLAVTAIRETFEESGLLLALANKPGTTSPPTVSETVLDEARFAIHQQKMLFEDFLKENNLKLDFGALLPFTKWITPIGPPKRFETEFFVTFLPASAGFSSGVKQERLPTPDGGQEVIEARFVPLPEALEDATSGKMRFMPPQVYIITTLAGILKGAENTAEQRAQVQTLASGMFGKMCINPIGKGKDETTGRTILAFEGDETRGGSKGRLHRALVKMDKAGPAGITLVRNFDVFTEIEPAALAGVKPAAKL